MKTIQRTERARILIAYYSLSGNTARVAKDLAKLIGGDIESIRDREHGVGFLGYLKATVDALRRVPAQIGPLSKNPADYTLTIMTVVALIFTPLVLAYQAWTYWVFRKRIGVHHIPASPGTGPSRVPAG